MIFLISNLLFQFKVMNSELKKKVLLLEDDIYNILSFEEFEIRLLDIVNDLKIIHTNLNSEIESIGEIELTEAEKDLYRQDSKKYYDNRSLRHLLLTIASEIENITKLDVYEYRTNILNFMFYYIARYYKRNRLNFKISPNFYEIIYIS